MFRLHAIGTSRRRSARPAGLPYISTATFHILFTCGTKYLLMLSCNNFMQPRLVHLHDTVTDCYTGTAYSNCKSLQDEKLYIYTSIFSRTVLLFS